MPTVNEDGSPLPGEEAESIEQIQPTDNQPLQEINTDGVSEMVYIPFRQTDGVSEYTVQAADLNAYPELSQQRVQLYQQVKFGSLYVTKYATGEKTSTVQEPWPREIGASKGKGITFKP